MRQAFARWPGLEKAEEQSTARGTGGHASPVMMTCRELWEIRWDQLHLASLQVYACARMCRASRANHGTCLAPVLEGT